MIDEEWRDIPGYDGYQVSNYGRVKTMACTKVDRNGRRYPVRERVKKSFISGKRGPREIVGFTRGHQRFVHELVRSAFVGDTETVEPLCIPAEKWRAVVGVPDHEVSDHGRVRSLNRVVHTLAGPQCHRGHLLVPTIVNGYHYIGLAGRTRSAHVVVAAAFLGPRPAGMHVCHNDGNPANNNVSNLRYDTPSGNNLDKRRHGTDHKVNQTHCIRGHLLAPPNLTHARLVRDGHRNCRSCNQTFAWRSKRQRFVSDEEFQRESDRRFRAITQGAELEGVS